MSKSKTLRQCVTKGKGTTHYSVYYNGWPFWPFWSLHTKDHKVQMVVALLALLALLGPQQTKLPKFCEVCGWRLTKTERQTGWCDDCNLPERSTIK